VPGPLAARTLRERVRRAWRVTLVVSAFAWFWSGAFLLSWLILPFVALLGGFDRVRRTRVCQRVVHGSFRVFHGYMRALGLLDARVGGPIPRRPDGGAVVLVCNHTTLVDVTAILAAHPYTAAFAKGSFVGSAVVGPLLRFAGYIPGTPGALFTAIDRLRDGLDVLVFPEGTRSPPDGLNPFHRGAFEIACRADVPVVLLVSTCAPSALTKDRAFWDQPDELALLTIRPAVLVEPRDFGMDSRALMSHVEGTYKKALGELSAILP
jgi:1-acyl-sn-glycerol-3-phosphate acyltransferase